MSTRRKAPRGYSRRGGTLRRKGHARLTPGWRHGRKASNA